MGKISLIIISFNEQKNIGRCLESAKDVADEIIVVDSFSTDKTKEICNSYGVIFQQVKWMGYSETKNYANSLATNDWILSLDSDEALSDDLKQSLLKEKDNFSNDAYIFSRKANYCGQWINHCGWYPDKKVRLWKKGKVFWKGDIHEELIFDKELKPKELKGDILHYTYYSISEHVLQANKFTDIAAKEKFEQGKTVGLFKLFLSPIVRFITSYFIRLGFLDGFYGFVISVITANSTFLKYTKLRQLIRTNKQI